MFWPLIQDKVHPTERDCYEYYFRKVEWFPDIYIYLSKSPELAHEHIQKRNQTGDASVSLEYLRELDRKYMNLVEGTRAYVIDANRTEGEIHEEICRILSENELLVNDSFRKEV